MKTVDIVVPCYNEEEVIDIFIKETNSVLNTIENYSFQYILVDDGSKDDTLKKFEALSAKFSNIKYISFSRNFGKEAGIYAGLQATSADYVILMDADLQHPPAMIPDMIKGIEEGYDCVAAQRTSRDGESKIRSFFSRSFYKLNNKITEAKLPYGAVDFRIMSRNMVDAVLSLSEVQRFSKGIFSWVGFDTKWIPYKNIERQIGTTKWSFWGLFKYAIDGITAFSVAPLRVIAVMGAIISLIAFVYIIVVLIQTLVTGIAVPGYVTTLCSVLFIGGCIELSVGVLGEYIGRIYMETKNRPIYITKRTNIDKNERKAQEDEGFFKADI